MNIRAVLFDMDGVLVDSKSIHLNAMKKLFLRHGLKISDADVKNIFGRVDEHNIKTICAKKKLTCDPILWGNEKRHMVVKLFKTGHLRSFPGALELVSQVRKKYRVGLATSSNKDERTTVLRKLKLNKSFDAVLGREDVKKHKPSPEVYRKLARKLDVKASECVVIEDSVAGVEAAKRAGMFCIAVTNSYPPSQLSRADLIVKRLDDKKVLELLKC